MIANGLRARRRLHRDVTTADVPRPYRQQRMRESRRPPATLKRVIDDAIIDARAVDDPWLALERAHIASQPWAWPHVRVHAAMLGVAWRHRDRHELIGQIVRLAVAGPGSLAGRYPPGNTGRARMRLIEHGPIPDDLAVHLVAR